MRRVACAALAALAVVFAETPARADEPDASPSPGSELGPAFRYTTPAERTYLRAAVEEVIILGLGYAQYATNKKGNAADWDLAPDWSSVEKKLDLSALTFDNNYFDTNWLTHPAAGFLYYSAARGNRLSIPVSFLFATTSSTLWEYFGELREHAAINDLIATPVTGLALGEPALQLGALFQRGRRGPASTALAWMFAPFKSMHDALDGLEPVRAEKFDDLGLPDDVWHRIALGGTVGVTHQRDGVTQGDGRLVARSRIVGIPGYGSAGVRGGWFTGGEVTDLRLQTGVSEGRLVDLVIASHVLPVGHAYQDVRLDEAGRLRGYGIVTGLHVGAEYGRHDWDRDRRRTPDRIALVDGGLTLEGRAHAGGWTFRTGLDGLVNFAGVDAYALPEERLLHSDIHLPSVLRNKDYYHAYGATLRPRVEAEDERFDAGADLRVDWFESIAGADVEPAATNVRLDASDRRILTRAWLGFRPVRHIRISLGGEWAEREGRVTSARASRSEVGMHGGAEVLF